MKMSERKILIRLMTVCNALGCALDLTAVCTEKLYDRQRAHELVSKVLYGVLSQSKYNDYADEDMELALVSLNKLEAIINKEYKYKNGY